MRKETIRDCFQLLEAEYGKQINQKKEVWGEIFKEYSDEKLIKAVSDFLRIGKFFPRVSDIIEMVEGTEEDEAELAWVCLKERISREGYYSSVSFPEYPAIGAVVENLGGSWCGFIDMITDKEEKWIKKDFIRIYPIMKKRGIFPHRLVGRFELDNLNAGYTEEFMIKRYGMTLDGKKIDRKLIGGKDGNRPKRLSGNSQQSNKKTQE